MATRGGTIYVIRNLLNGKCYVGQTCNIGKRLAQHRSGAHKGRPANLVQTAVTEFGWENFEVFTLAGIPPSALDDLERALIRALNSTAPAGYNLEFGGVKNRRQHPDSNRRRSIAVSGARHPLFGTHLSEERKRHLSEIWTGRRISEKTRLKIGEANRGKIRTPAMRLALSQRMKGRFAGAASPVSRRVACGETGELFGSLGEAARRTGVSRAHIGECCRGKLHSAGGRHWSFATQEDA